MFSRIRIGICDDDIQVCEMLYQTLLNYEKLMQIKIDVKLYYSGERLLKELEQGEYFDILFLDIQLKNIDGLNVALKMRYDLYLNFTHIYYISAYRQDTRKILRTRPMDLIPKPIVVKEVYNALQRSLELMDIMDSEEKCFEFKIQNVHYKVPIKDILYFQKCVNKIIIVTKQKRHEFYSTLENIYNELKEYDFIFSDRSFLVNFAYVESFSRHELKLHGISETLPVARARYADLFDKWTKQLSKRNIEKRKIEKRNVEKRNVEKKYSIMK